MNGFAWCLSVIFVALVFGMGFCIVGSVLINVYFEVKKRKSAEAAKDSLEAMKQALEHVSKTAEALKGMDNNSNDSEKKD